MNVTRTYNKDEFDFKYREFDGFARNQLSGYNDIVTKYYSVLYDFSDKDNPKQLYIDKSGELKQYNPQTFQSLMFDSHQELIAAIDRFYEENGDLIV